MTTSNPVSWLARHARRGVTDLPRNIVWAVDTVLKNPATSAGRTLQSVGQQATSAIADVSPFADGTDSRLQRVDAALERAHKLGAQAREEAEEAKDRATRDIETARKNAVSDIYAQAADLSTSIAEKILRRNLNADDQRQLVESSLQQFQSASGKA